MYTLKILIHTCLQNLLSLDRQKGVVSFQELASPRTIKNKERKKILWHKGNSSENLKKIILQALLEKAEFWTDFCDDFLLIGAWMI